MGIDGGQWSRLREYNGIHQRMDEIASLFLRVAFTVADAEHSLSIRRLEPLVVKLKSAGMSEQEIVEAEICLDRDGLVTMRSTNPRMLSALEITSAGVDWFHADQYGLARYHKILGDIARLKQERVMSGVKVTADSLAAELKLPLMLVHHVLSSR